MKRLNLILAMAVAAATLALVATQARGQYYTPLRYDLRYSSPTYIPGGTLRFGPEQKADPYAFGSPQYGNLGMTGNLRLGKSFQGASPYRASGTQLSADLPSLGLSNFRRDSIGVEDIGSGLEYGQVGAYFPGSGSVTTPWSAAQRFATPLPGDRAPYAPRDVNAPTLNRPLPPARVFSPSGGPATPAEGVAAAGTGFTIPRSALDYVDALIDGRASPMPGEVNDPRAALGDSAAAQSPYGPLDDRLGARPEMTVRPIEEPDATAENPEAAQDPSSALFWLKRQAAPAQGSEAGDQKATPFLTRKPWAGAAPEEEIAWPEADPAEPKTVPAPPTAYTPVSPYGVYVERGHAAMKEPAYDKAEALYSAAVALEPDRPAGVFGRIHALLGGRMYLQAIVVLERELKRHPDWAKVVPDLKAVYAKPEVYRRIVDDVKRELTTKPNQAGFNFLAGYVLYGGGDVQGARPYLEKAATSRGESGPEQAILKVIEDRKSR